MVIETHVSTKYPWSSLDPINEGLEIEHPVVYKPVKSYDWPISQNSIHLILLNEKIKKGKPHKSLLMAIDLL